ncbi:MAG: NAD(P)-binding protein [Syntrophobacteraceae bacterium]|nr:NAD(P)-binding protein [Syntrophobacteraceae bacterium]
MAVVGAGPAGASAACILAGRGNRTIVFERGGYPGSKNKFE